MLARWPAAPGASAAAGVRPKIPAYGGELRSELATYPGGHMFYTRDTSRVAFREAAKDLYGRALLAREGD